MTQQDQQVAIAAIVEDRAWLGKLEGELRGLLAGVFAQARSRFTAFAYISALLAVAGDRKSCWQLAEEAGHATPRRMQALLAECAWDRKAALARLQAFILAHCHPGDPGAILVLDETAELKKRAQTVGVARQHAGITGQAENCQTVVFAAYVTARALFDSRLYLPEQRCQDAARRQRARVPEEVGFATKTESGTAMVTGAISAGTPFAWLAGDEVYGRAGKLRSECEKAGKGHVLTVPVNFKVTLPSLARHRQAPHPARPAASRR